MDTPLPFQPADTSMLRRQLVAAFGQLDGHRTQPPVVIAALAFGVRSAAIGQLHTVVADALALADTIGWDLLDAGDVAGWEHTAGVAAEIATLARLGGVTV